MMQIQLAVPTQLNIFISLLQNLTHVNAITVIA